MTVSTSSASELPISRKHKLMELSDDTDTVSSEEDVLFLPRRFFYKTG